MSRTKYIVIYDGDCGFCESSVNLMKKLDWLRRFAFVPFQDDQVLQKYKGLTKEICEKEIYLVKENGEKKIYSGGYDALKIMSLHLPLTFLISWFFFLPGVTQTGKTIYKLIAQNRHKIKIGKKICKL